MSHHLFRQLRTYLPPREYALFSEVRNSTGFKGDHSADAVAMGLYPSRGLEVLGYEFKVSRSDWLRELKNAQKAEAICRYCNRWFIVAPKDVVKPEELPATWGLLVSGEKGLRQSVAAPLLEPEPLDRKFIAALLRRAQEQAEKPVEELRTSIHNEVRAELGKKAAEREEQQQSRENRRIADLEHTISSFERLSGVNIRQGWQLPEIGAAVKMLIGRGMRVPFELNDSAARLEQMVKTMRDASAEIEAMNAQPVEASP